MAADIGYGIDTSVLAGADQDLDDTFTEMNGVQILQEDVYKGITTPSAPVVLIGSELRPLLFWEDPPVSFDVRDWLNDSLARTDMGVLEARIEAIYEADRRFTSLKASAGLSLGTLSATITGQASGQPLSLTLTADSSKVTVS